MITDFDNVSVSVAMVFGDSLPYDLAGFQEGLRAAVRQDHPRVEVIVVDGRAANAAADFLPDDVVANAVRHLPGEYANRAAMWNAALAAATGEFLLLVLNDQARVVLKRSAVRTLAMAAARTDQQEPHASACAGPRGLKPAALRGARDGERRPRGADATAGTGSGRYIHRLEACATGIVYADYERVEADGTCAEVHLLDWHEGRLRDTVDFGSAILFRVDALRDAGGFDEQYNAADLYDARLRISEKHGVVHVANLFAGALYSVAAAGKEHNVFDYLLAGKDAQLEMERACTEHLKRIGAYLAPGANVREVHRLEARATEHRLEARATDGRRGQSPDATADATAVATVVTPVNNRPEFIGRAIESVQAQSVQQVEMIIVVNGGEDDPTSDEVRRYMEGGDKYDASKPAVRLIVVDVNNLGLCLNAGVAAARGEYYVQLDSDDRLKPDAVEKLLAVFDSDPTIGMVIGSYEVWTLDDATGELHRNEEIPVVTHGEWTADNGRNNLLRINGAGAPRAAHVEAIRDAGWFGVNDSPRSRNYGEDYDLVLRISERYTIGRVWDPIYEVIRHSGGTDHGIDQATIDRNDNAKDAMRLEALHRRCSINRQDAKTPRTAE